jgi:hypothetical protein
MRPYVKKDKFLQIFYFQGGKTESLLDISDICVIYFNYAMGGRMAESRADHSRVARLQLGEGGFMIVL